MKGKSFLFAILLVNSLFLSFPASAQANPRVAVVINYERFEVKPETEQKLNEELKKLFSPQYSVVRNARLNASLKKRLTEKPFKDQEVTLKEALFALCHQYNYDAILYLSYGLESANHNNNFLHWQKNAQMRLKAYMFHKKTANYIYRNQIMRKANADLKKFKDLSELSDVASEAAEKCHEQLLSPFELPLAKRTMELS